VNLDLIRRSESDLCEELFHLFPLVALELQYLPILSVFHHSSVTVELFLHHLDDPLQVVVLGDSLDRCQTLAPVPLLDSDVDVFFLGSLLLLVPDVSEGILLLQVGYSGVSHVAVKEQGTEGGTS